MGQHVAWDRGRYLPYLQQEPTTAARSPASYLTYFPPIISQSINQSQLLYNIITFRLPQPRPRIQVFIPTMDHNHMDHSGMDHGDMDHGHDGMHDMCNMNVRAALLVGPPPAFQLRLT